MAINCQEAMVEAQASERIPAPASDASATTIESLRARLLSERAASKEARQQAQQIAEKVSELHARLDVEIECRKKAEAAMEEVLEALKAKGLAMEQVIFTASLPLENLEGEEMVLVNGSKDVESEPSSGEESCHALMEEKQTDLDDPLNTYSTNGHDATQEGHASGDDSLSETQCNLKETTENDLSVVDNCSANCDDRDFSHQHVVNTGHIKDIGNGSLSAGQRSEESSKDYSDQSCLLEPGRITAKHAEGPVKLECNAETGLTSGNDKVRPGNELPGLTLSNQMVVHQEVDRKAESDASLSDGHRVYALANGANCPDECLSPRKFDDLIGCAGKTRQHAHWLQQDEIPQCQMPSTKSLAGFRPKETHPGFSPINGLPYNVTNTNSDHWMYDVSTGETPFGSNRYADYKRRHAYFPSTAYQSRDPLLSEASGFNRHPGAHISDAVLALVDDKNGKLGDILMALHLAKQQLRDERHNKEKHEPSTPTAADGKAYVGYHGDGLYQPPYHSKRPEAHSQAPIIHLPVSPISDHGFSAFERHDGLRRSSSVSSNFMMPWSEAHIQPRGELHLGNGITLYTD